MRDRPRGRGRLGTTLGFLALLLVPVRPAWAQAGTFPYELGRRDLLVLPAGLGLSALGQALADRHPPLTVDEIARFGPDDVNGFDRRATRYWSPAWADRSSTYRDALLGGAVLLSFAPELARGRWSNTVTLGTMFVEASLLLDGVTSSTKRLAGRKRPWIYNTSLSPQERAGMATDDEDVYRSFYSGHAATAFMLATLASTIVADVHGRSRWTDALWASSLSLAALTAYARVRAGVHYPSDVLVGALVGSAIGYGVPRLHRRNGPVRLSVAPGVIAVRLRVGGTR